MNLSMVFNSTQTWVCHNAVIITPHWVVLCCSLAFSENHKQYFFGKNDRSTNAYAVVLIHHPSH
jgi:hypothetical protein